MIHVLPEEMFRAAVCTILYPGDDKDEPEREVATASQCSSRRCQQLTHISVFAAWPAASTHVGRSRWSYALPSSDSVSKLHLM